MYTLYYLPGACSLATQVVLRELKQPIKLMHRQDCDNFASLNPVGAVPVLVDGDEVLREGAAIMLYLLNKHQSDLFPQASAQRQLAIQDILFANATMHPAYSRLFFTASAIKRTSAQKESFDAAAKTINTLWQVVEHRLQRQPFLGGSKVSAADIMLAVYSRWGEAFPVAIEIGKKTALMIKTVIAMPSFQQALAAENRPSLTQA